jgi:hypothetical protein
MSQILEVLLVVIPHFYYTNQFCLKNPERRTQGMSNLAKSGVKVKDKVVPVIN